MRRYLQKEKEKKKGGKHRYSLYVCMYLHTKQHCVLLVLFCSSIIVPGEFDLIQHN